MQRLFWLVLLMAPALLQAQDVTGIWQGHFRSSTIVARSSGLDDRYKFEVQIAQHGKRFEGVTYSYLSPFFYGKAAAAGTVNPLTGKVLLQEGKILEFRNSSGDICTMTCFLQYTRSGDEEFMEGPYVSMNTRDSSNCGRGTVFLRKVPVSDFYTEPFVARREKEIGDSLDARKKLAMLKPATHPRAPTTTKRASHPAAARTTTRSGKPSTAKTPPSTRPRPQDAEPPTRTAPMARINVPSASVRTSDSSGGIGRKFPTIVPGVIKDRENPVVKMLVIHTHEVTLNIYDDGAIDHDTVSVYLDNRQVINHAMLTDRPLIVTLHLDEANDYHEIVMVADNEGEIPPNTSLMIVKAGDKEYEVRIITTEQRNAVIKFQYVK
jgi:riboflavin synthase